MLREQHWRQEAEIERLKKMEAKALSADEALQDLRDKVRAAEEEMKLLQIRLDEAEAARKKADEAVVAAIQRAEEAERLKADAEKAAEKAVVDFKAEGWKAEDQLPFCYEVVAERLNDWTTKDPAGQEFWMNEMQAFYDCGQYRMQKLIYRKLRRRFRKMRPRGLSLPRRMKNPDEDLKLPLLERQPPILSSSEGEEPWSDSDDYLLEGPADSQADEGGGDDDADDGHGDGAVDGGVPANVVA
ncbi:unnamed protein product [Cuscuta epithymum]|uniref:Uncharacterized protein n=1 Tax=Cuscuta epithymum TaxID=186058 RepID=A0AAV0GF05_9ASTE|nr:unnamed protein product [Cuscuta epithymum]